MLRFIQHHLDTISGIEIFPVIGLVIFLTFFVGLLIYLMKEDKNHIDRMKQLPLQDGANDNDL